MVVIYQSPQSKQREHEEQNSARARHISQSVGQSTNPDRKPTYQPVNISVNSLPIDIIESSQVIEDKIDDPQLNSYIASFLKSFEKASKKSGDEFSANVNVSDVLGGLARCYERIRTTVEYKGEHLLRRNAIERILKRIIGTTDRSYTKDIYQKKAASLVKELIWAKYIPNNEISTSKVEVVATTIEKYEKILTGLDSLPDKLSSTKAKSWILGVASSEIEDVLDPSHRDLFVTLMFEWLKEHSNWSDKGVSDHEKNTQMFLAIHRAYPKSDDATLRYYLLLQELPNWNTANDELIRKFTLDFPKIYSEIEKHLDYPGKLYLYRKIIRFCAPFEILRQVVLKNKHESQQLLRDETLLSEQVREVCDNNYKQISKRVNTGIVRSIIYIFLTKVFLAFLMEVPYEVYRYGDIRYIPLSINIIFPPIMMFLIGLSIKTPGVKNTELINERIGSIVYKAKKQKTVVNFNAGSVGTFAKIFASIYGVLFLVVFGGISLILFEIGYSLFGVIVFFFFLSLVLLFAYRVRYHAQVLKIEAEKEGILSHLASYLMLPFLNLGFFLSRGLAQINFFTVLLDLLIEAPLKSMIELFEEWIGFMKEKRQEVIEVPE